MNGHERFSYEQHTFPENAVPTDIDDWSRHWNNMPKNGIKPVETLVTQPREREIYI